MVCRMWVVLYVECDKIVYEHWNKTTHGTSVILWLGKGINMIQNVLNVIPLVMGMFPGF